PGGHHYARLRSRQCHCRHSDAAHAKRNAASLGKRLRAHRPRQGTARAQDYPQTRPAQRAHADYYVGCARIRHFVVRGRADRTDFHYSGIRQAYCRRGFQPGLCRRSGRRSCDRHNFHFSQFAGRHRLPPRQSAPAGNGMTDTVLNAPLVGDASAESPAARAWRRLLRRKGAVVGLCVIVLFILAAVLAPLIVPYDPVVQSWTTVRHAPSLTHIFGTDDVGRDVFSRVIYGTRASLFAGVISVGIALSIGIPLGLIAGYRGGFIDALLSRITDAMLACPFIILAIALAAFLGPSLGNAMIAIGITTTPVFVRLTRGQVMAVKVEEYIEAARAVGNPRWRIALV